MTRTTSDFELLHDYATTRSQRAFAELVNRHVDLVYSAARRQVRDPHLAEDVTQAVFLILSQKAASIGSSVSVAGWLYKTTRYAANNARRGEMRRKFHETKAGESMQHVVGQVEIWERIEPELDAAVARLPARDRQALVLRFFKQLSLKELGTAMGVSEDAAKVRVSRAIAKLRRMLGVSTPPATLALALTEHSIQAAPSALADAIISATCAGTASNVAISIAKGAIAAMRRATLGLAAACVAALVLTAAAVGVVVTQLAGPAGQLATSKVISSAASSPTVAQQPAADRSTPTIALKTLMQEMIAGTDHGGGWIAEHDFEREAGEAVSDMVFEANQLRVTAQKHLGQMIKVPLAVDLPWPEQLDGDVRVRIEDNHAMVKVPGSSLDIPMDHIDGQWKLGVSGLAIAAGFDSTDEMRDECQRLFDGFRSLRDSVQIGLIQSSNELIDALNALKPRSR